MKFASVEYKRIPGGGVLTIFTNHKTGETFTRTYKTMAAAHGQGTRFLNRMSRVYLPVWSDNMQ